MSEPPVVVHPEGVAAVPVKAAAPQDQTAAGRFQRASEALYLARTPAALYGQLATGAASVLEAAVARVLLLRGDRLQALPDAGQPAGDTAADSPPDLWAGVPVPGTPVHDLLLGERGTVFRLPGLRVAAWTFGHADELRVAYPDLDRRQGAPAAGALLALAPGGESALLVLEYREPHDFTAEERGLLAQLGQQAALMLGRLGGLETGSRPGGGAEHERSVLVQLGAALQPGGPTSHPSVAPLDQAQLTDAGSRIPGPDRFGPGHVPPLPLDHQSPVAEAPVWTAADLLVLAQERAGEFQRLALQNAELEAQARALQAFAELNRDFGSGGDSELLIRRAQEVVLSLLPGGYAAYYQPEGEVWRLYAQTGDRRDPDLQAAAEAGLPLKTTRSLTIPWETGEPYYLEEYDQHEDLLDAYAVRRGGLASVAIQVNGRPFGVFGVALFGQRHWSATDRAVLEMVARALGLALEHHLSLVELAQRTQELERSNQELQQFAYVVSHDLQEPLRSITSFSSLLIARALSPRPGDSPAVHTEQLQTYGRYVTESGTRMTGLLTDLLAFSRVNAQAQPHVPVNTRLVLAQVEQDLRQQIESSGATLQIGELPWVLGDATQLRQLFQNLIGNGLKFRHPDRAPVVRVTARLDTPGAATFEVQDNGIGIEEEYFERIFVIFQRLHARRSYPGSGIGLAIAQKVALQHGAGLQVSSVLGEGSTFSVTLPLAGSGQPA